MEEEKSNTAKRKHDAASPDAVETAGEDSRIFNKLRKKILDMKTKMQEEIFELSSEEEQCQYRGEV